MFSLLVALTVSEKYDQNDYHSIELPIKSKHDLEIIKTPSEESEHVTYVDVPGGILPVYITFKTQSSPIHVKQEHKSAKGSQQMSDSKDEPHHLTYEVLKPVYQEVKEIIQPYRKIIQVIEPVKEERYTKVHKAERKRKYSKDQSSAYGKGGNDGYVDNKYAKLADNYKIEDYKRYKD